MELFEQIRRVKSASASLALLNDDQRNEVLHDLAKALQLNSEKILMANQKDLQNLDKQSAFFDRLSLDEKRIEAIANDVESVTALPVPIGRILDTRIRPNGLSISKVSVPLGVVAVIYESRPNVTVDVFTLCFKSGNACILKGGKEANNSNRALVSIIHDVLSEHKIDTYAALLLEPTRENTEALLHANGLVDVCIPRGGKSLINFVRNNATIPVIETGAGVVHAYFDMDGDINKGRAIINNAKTRRVSVCNALDCLIIHKERIKDLHLLVQPLQQSNVEIFADEEAYKALYTNYPNHLLFQAAPEHYGQEFLSYKMAIKTVESTEQAIDHIMLYSSGHSEAIITENKQAADFFTQRIDAAVVYVNASTAFTDGGQFGMVAEIGISTQKLHARGPMGLDALTSYKWIVHGNGNTRN